MFFIAVKMQTLTFIYLNPSQDLLLLEKGGAALGIDKADPKNDLLNNLPPAIDPLASLGIDSGEFYIDHLPRISKFIELPTLDLLFCVLVLTTVLKLLY